ncbi:MAG: acetylornithine deacetylase, partial [Gammaproteobacteria bacterium]
AGFDLERQHVAHGPDKLNLVARLGDGDDGLVLSGHTDTVPCDASGWHGDPFTLEERDGRCGLGTADMKVFFPIVLAALEGVERRRLRRPLVMLATADEESSMAGARHLEQAGRRLGRHVLIGEPTALVPIRKHKGIALGRIVLEGRSGHSSDPRLGANALDRMHEILGDLKAWRAEAAERHRDADFKLPGPTLNLGSIRGGDSPNRICGECELLFDIRAVPGLDIEGALEEIAGMVRRRAAASGVTGRLELPMQPLPALATAPDAALVSALEAATGTRAASVAFATEGPFLNALGAESVIFGPGDIATAHQPDEHVEIAKVETMIAILRTLIEQFCCHE